MYIAKSDKEIVSAAELVKKLRMPKAFLRKVLQALQKRGVLKSTKGSRGGFMLARFPDKIFLSDLIKIFQGEVKIIECLFRKKVCPRVKTCPLRKKIKNIEKMVLSELKSVSIASLLKT